MVEASVLAMLEEESPNAGEAAISKALATEDGLLGEYSELDTDEDEILPMEAEDGLFNDLWRFERGEVVRRSRTTEAPVGSAGRFAGG